ncbi:MAG: LysR family transcriptional regulator [Pigmentiphaga sp.]|nr:LysR family transcriptional regulator [Pigmentiphaga sp.]
MTLSSPGTIVAPPVSATVLHGRLQARARFRHLQIWLRIAELGTTHKAAESLGMTQPAVTHALAELEKLIGGRLFFRHARGMRLTPTGEMLLPTARRILAALADIAEQSASLAHHAAGCVRVGAIGGAIAGILARTLPGFSARHPDVLVQLRAASPAELEGLVALREIDLALCREPEVIPEGWEYIRLMDDRFVIVGGARHWRVPLKNPSPETLAEHTWLAVPPDTASGAALGTLFENVSQWPRFRLVSSRLPEVLWTMLRAEPLLTLVPHSTAWQLLDAGQLVEIPTLRPMKFLPLGMLLPLENRARATQTMAEFLREACATA